MIRITIAAFACALLFSCRDDQATTETAASDEGYRPQFHFSPPAGWMNDPNGLVYHQGSYHLFYQHYPDSNVWGPMHWGHATSSDLVTWAHQPIALYPDSLGMIFSGSAVFDEKNTSGLGTPEQPPLVALFTYHQPDLEKAGRQDYQYQGLAYSVDAGKTWRKYERNPVLANPGQRDFRDPKVFYYPPDNGWVMLLAVGDHIEFYTSPNLLDWTYASSFGQQWGNHGGVWECPDLFELTVEGTQDKKWVMLVSINPGALNGGSGTQYFIGDFNGREFSYAPSRPETLYLDYGTDNYAGVTWNNVPDEDGRRIFIGWMSNWEYGNVVPTYTWRSAMTFPRELGLRNTPSGLRLTSRPVAELRHIRAPDNGQTVADVLTETDTASQRIALSSPLQELLLTVERKDAATGFELVFSNDEGDKIVFGLNGPENEYYFDRSASGELGFSEAFGRRHRGMRASTSLSVNLRLLLDVTSLEMFADEGTAVMTEIFFPTAPFDAVQVRAPGAGVVVSSVKVNELQPIWEKSP